MSYRTDLANRAGLFRKYASLHEDNDNWTQASHQNIIYFISSIMVSIENIHLLQEECIQQFNTFEEKLSNLGEKIYFRSPTLHDIFIHLSNAMTSLRLLQNEMIKIIPRLPSNKNQLPTRITELVKKFGKIKFIDEDFENLIKKYWFEDNGVTVKHYRDFEQHYGTMFSYAWINTKTKKMMIPLYDFPSIEDMMTSKFKKQSDLTFHKNIDAFDYIQSHFLLIHELIEQLSERSGYTEERLFDFNTVVKGTESIATIFCDPNQQLLCCQVGFFENEKMKGIMHIKNIDLNKYTFIKKPYKLIEKYTCSNDYIFVEEAVPMIDIALEAPNISLGKKIN